MIDDKGRCCGRKPMVYKSRYSTSTGPHRYCPRCDRAYDLDTNDQISNWAWKQIPGTELFERQTNKATCSATEPVLG